MANTSSIACIRRFCLDCQGGSSRAVRECPDEDCRLHGWRLAAPEGVSGEAAAREARRGSRYNGIALDPPSFGRGAQGQIWKIEEGLEKLLADCRAILKLDEPHFLVLSCHSQGFSPVSLGRCLAAVFPESADRIECGEMLIPDGKAGRFLPAGIQARFFCR